MNIKTFIFLLLPLYVNAQLDTVIYNDGSYCICDKSYRPEYLKKLPIYTKDELLNKASNIVFRDFQICYNKKNIIEYEFKYLSSDKKSDYIQRHRNKNDILIMEEIVLLSDTNNVFIQEKYWTDTGIMKKEDTWKKNERILMEYHLDENNTLKSISKWKEVERKDTLDFFQDKNGYYWVESRYDEGKAFVPNGVHYEFYPNGLLKSIGKYKAISYKVYRNYDDYKAYETYPIPTFLAKDIDPRQKIGVWEYYSDKGKLTRTQKY